LPTVLRIIHATASRCENRCENDNEGDTMSASTGPLAGVKVLELGTLIAGPFAARFMAEFGADVIKIEDPNGGDPLRKWRKLYPEVGGTSLWWAVQARNKKSVTVNLKSPDGSRRKPISSSRSSGRVCSRNSGWVMRCYPPRTPAS
jgi:hypothetical protein